MQVSYDIKALGFSESDAAKETRRLAKLITTRKRTYPGSRAFGAQYDCVDRLPHEAMRLFSDDLYEGVEKWMPEIEIDDIGSNFNGKGDMQLSIKAVPNREQ